MSDLTSLHLGGVEVRTSKLITVEGPSYTVTRTWRERLFTRPWRPGQKYRTVTPRVPDPNVYICADNSILIHPDMLPLLEERIAEANARHANRN